MVYKSGQIFLPFCHNARVWRTDRGTDRRTDRQTDRRTEFSSLYRVCITCSAVKTLLHLRVKYKSLKMLQFLYQNLMTQLCQTFMITLWILNWFEKHILRIWNIVSLFQWPLTQLAYCQSSKCPPLTVTQARTRAFHQLRNQLHSVEGRAKCPTVP